MNKTIWLLIPVFISLHSFSQPFTLEVKVKNQPENKIILGTISGDRFTPVDSLPAQNNTVRFTFSPDARPGMYRLVFGQTLYAKIMNDPPQQIDFVFNDEHIIFETDFDKPEDNLQVILSEENRIWFEFRGKEKQFQKDLNELEAEIGYYRQAEQTAEAADRIEKYNRLQKERDHYLLATAEKNPERLAAKWIRMYREPFLDGNLTPQERKELFQKEYFTNIDFSDETLIDSSVGSDRVFRYLTSYNQKGWTKKQLEQDYCKAVDVVFAGTGQNPKVAQFIRDYVIQGFEILKMDTVIEYIRNQYPDGR
jgi:hypothetical protein